MLYPYSVREDSPCNWLIFIFRGIGFSHERRVWAKEAILVSNKLIFKLQMSFNTVVAGIPIKQKEVRRKSH